MNKTEENARMLDPMRFKVTKNMPYVPGGPDNNNPMNVTDNASPSIQSASIYGDYQQNYGQMGTGAVNPMNVSNSGIQQKQSQVMQRSECTNPIRICSSSLIHQAFRCSLTEWSQVVWHQTFRSLD